MRERILGLVEALRGADVSISVAETMDAVAAVMAAGVERTVLREALAATLVKDEDDRRTFDRLFDAMFPLGGVGAARRPKRARTTGPEEPAQGRGQGGEGEGRGSRSLEDEPAESAARRHRS